LIKWIEARYRQVVAHFKAAPGLGFSYFPSYVLLQPSPQCVFALKQGKQVGVVRGLLKAMPEKRQPVCLGVMPLLLEVMEMRQHCNQFLQSILLPAYLGSVLRVRWAQPWPQT